MGVWEGERERGGGRKGERTREEVSYPAWLPECHRESHTGAWLTCLSVCLCVCMSICLCLSLSVCMYVCLSLSLNSASFLQSYHKKKLIICDSLCLRTFMSDLFR